jgi:PKD repeat protein
MIIGTGWTGNAGQWIAAGHLLNNLGGQNNVKLKITFDNTLMSTPMEGFAFDDIYIYNWICTPPVANFTYNVSDFTVEFTNASTNATSYSWNFGDGNISTDTNPTHIYTSNGTYPVTLIAINDCSSDTITKNVLLTEIEETSNNNIISCYPNPTNGLFYINIDCSRIENVEIAIENVIGSIVYSEEIGTISGIYNKQFDFSDFSKGIYYLKINSTTQNFVKKIIIE